MSEMMYDMRDVFPALQCVVCPEVSGYRIGEHSATCSLVAVREPEAVIQNGPSSFKLNVSEFLG
jgi:hypothetical protein